MPILAAGLFKQLAYKVQTADNTAPGQTGGQLLRRVESSIDLSKDTYSSNEKRVDFQRADFRHGVRRVGGQIKGELSPKTYADLFGIALKRDFTAVTALTGLSLTIAGTGPTYTVTRSAGSWLTDGAKVGDVIRLTTGTLNAANLSKNLLVTDVVALTLTVIPLNGVALVAEGPIANCGVAWPGKKTFIPTTGHTDKIIAFEHWYSDIAQSELFLDCKVNKIALELPPTGMATVSLDVMGLDMADTATKRGGVATTSQYFTNPTAVTTTGALAAVNGLLRVGGAIVATVTGLSIEISPAYGGNPVVGSNTLPQLLPSPVIVKGQFTAYFDGVTLRNAFVNETEVDLIAAFTSDNTATADFISFALPRIKLGGAGKNDADDGIVQTFPFEALLSLTGGAGVKTERTTISMQDSAA